MSARPKAKWKVEYEAKLPVMDNKTLLDAVLEHQGAHMSEFGDDHDEYALEASLAELTRRLTEIGFLSAGPGKPPRQMSGDTLHSI